MNIVLVDVAADRNFLTVGYHPHPGLAYIAAFLELQGHAVHIVDPVSSNYNFRQMIRQIIEFNPRIVGFTATTAARFAAIEAIKAVKREINVFIIAGGPHFHPTAGDAMSKVSDIDCIVKGEGERTMVEIAMAIESGESLSKIPGIFFRSNDSITETLDRIPVDNLDTLPWPAYHLFNLRRYKTFVLGRKGTIGLGVISSRGCPCRCIFCSITALQKHNFRKRSSESFLDEISYYQKTYGYQGFIFNDDTFTIDRNHAVNICNGILKRKMNICWSSLARVNTVDRDLLLLMKAAGCCYIMYGVESGSDATLKKLKKGITAEQAIKAMEITADVGIPFDALFMISLPGETMEDVQKTIDLIKRFSSFPNARTPYGFTCIYPGTEVEALAYKEGVLPNDFSWNTHYRNPVYPVLGTDPFTPCWETPDLSLEDLKAMIFKSRSLTYKIRHIIYKLTVLSWRDILSCLRIAKRILVIH